MVQVIILAQPIEIVPFDWGGQFGYVSRSGAIMWNQDWRSNRLLFDGTCRHVTAEMLHYEVLGSQKKVSLATIYNTLHLFTKLGLLREIIVDSDCSYFDTNTTNHHHFYREDTRELIDIDGSDIQIGHLPKPPEGSQITRVEIVVRTKKTN